MNIWDCLSEARAAMKNLDAELAAQWLDRFDRQAREQPLSPEAIERCAPILDQIRALAKAACAGVEEAHLHIRAILDASARLEVYDSAGQRNIRSVSMAAATRF